MNTMYFSARRGNAFIMVVAVLAVIFIAATFFMSSTIEQGRHTEHSMRGVQSYGLAEAALERALHIIQKELNDPAVFSATSGKKDSVAVKLRMPLTRSTGTMSGVSDNLGKDDMLDVKNGPDLVKSDIVLTLDDLRLEPKGEDRLDKLAMFMTDGKATKYDAKVTIRLEKAFRVSPGKDYADYKVPGVDIAWLMRPDVQRFLEGKGYSALHLEFPKDMCLFLFEIPVTIMGIPLVRIDVPTLLDPVIQNFTPINPQTGKGWGIKDLFSADMMARKMFELLGMPDKYPIKLSFDKIKFPQKNELWPSGVNLGAMNYDQILEKYGEMRFIAEASIDTPGQPQSRRKIEATKEFKVADVEPIAPMYSLFVSNTANERLVFNDFGGQFFINNCDMGGLWTKIKGAVTGTADTPPDQIERFEVPGLIRVNYKGNEPMTVNIGFLGATGGPKIWPTQDSFRELLYGAEWLLLIAPKTKIAASAKTYNVEMDTKPSFSMVTNADTGTKVPSSISWGSGNVTTKNESTWFKSAYTGKPPKPDATPDQIKANDKKNFWTAAAAGCNFIPNVGRMDVNVIQLGISLAIRNPFYDLGATLSGAGVSGLVLYNAFQPWELPYMGTWVGPYTLPTLGWGSNKTHLFGCGAMAPTLTRDIEGLVGKTYLKWNMCIVGMSVTSRLPLLPFPPPWCFLPPIPIPIWYTEQIVKKYDYNLDCLKSLEFNKTTNMDEVNTKMVSYDPELAINFTPNLYSPEQYAKKANYYYKTYGDFINDLPHRMTAQTTFGPALVLNGVTYIADNMGTNASPFKPLDKDNKPLDTLYVVGRGMIVCSGNMYLGCDIKAVDPASATTNVDYKTVFSMVVRRGGMVLPADGKTYTFEGSLYTEKGLYVPPSTGFHIIGNWATNVFSKPRMQGNVGIDYVSTRTRSALGSLHPEWGRFDPRRYYATISPTWTSWKAD